MSLPMNNLPVFRDALHVSNWALNQTRVARKPKNFPQYWSRVVSSDSRWKRMRSTQRITLTKAELKAWLNEAFKEGQASRERGK